MPPKLPGMYFDEERGRYFAIPKSMSNTFGGTESARVIQAKIKKFKPAAKSNSEIKADKSRKEFTSKVEKVSKLFELEFKNIGSFRSCSPTLLHLSCLFDDESRKASLANVNAFDTGTTFRFKSISGLEWESTMHLRTKSDVLGYYCVSKDLNYGFIYSILLNNDGSIGSHITKKRFQLSNNRLELDLNGQKCEMFKGIDELIAIGLNTQDELIDHNELKRWLLQNQLRRKHNKMWLFGNKEHIVCKSEMTFLTNDRDFVYMGFRDGTVVIQYSKCTNSFFSFNIGSAVCSIKSIYVNEFLVCVVSGISNVLRSYKFDHITFEWLPFIEYKGYRNAANLSQNIKVFSSSATGFNDMDGIFIVESENERLMDKELLFYDFTRSKPLKCSEFRLQSNKYTFTSWFIAGDKLLIFNRRQQEILVHQILQLL